MNKPQPKTVLWWGRSDINYSRNRIIRQIMQRWGWNLIDFNPVISVLGFPLALCAGLPKVDLIWVPCFRQRDLQAAFRYARWTKSPVLFDPLISSYDKQVYERKKLEQGSSKAEKLKQWETKLFSKADILIADTQSHADFFIETLGADKAKTYVIKVGAEEKLFTYQTRSHKGKTIEVLFYGSFIPLQGTDVIVKAAKMVPEVKWTLIGGGPALEDAKKIANGASNITFESWVPYQELAKRIGQADILLGVFGSTPKAQRVIPNKVYQALACGRPVITLETDAYDSAIREKNQGGIGFVPAGKPEALAEKVRAWSSKEECLEAQGENARQLYDEFLSENIIEQELLAALKACLSVK